MKKLIILSLLLTANTGYSLIGGNEAKLGQGNGVISIIVSDESSEEEYFSCTATKVGPRTLITAAHCFERKTPSSIGFSTKLRNEEFEFEALEIEDIQTHSSYNGDQEDSEEDFGANSIDLAIVHVKPNDEFDKIQVRGLDFSEISANSKVEIWGYGCRESNNKTDDYFPLKKYAANITQDSSKVVGDFGIFTKQINATKNLIYKNSILTTGLDQSKNASSLCSGDSGGPLFHNDKLVGVNFSFLANIKKDGTFKTGRSILNLHVRVSIVKDWIQENLK